MSAARPFPAVAETALYLALGLAATIAPLLPLSPGGRLLPPDLPFCLTVAWVVRRPARLPLPAVLVVGLLADLLLSRPLGLGALGLLVVAEAFRHRAHLFWSAPFPLEWLAAGGAFAALLAAEHLALTLVLAEPPGLALSLRHLAATAIAYPLGVLGLVWVAGIRAPSLRDGGHHMPRSRVRP
jgi:rod shape-determining protein MreD